MNMEIEGEQEITCPKCGHKWTETVYVEVEPIRDESRD